MYYCKRKRKTCFTLKLFKVMKHFFNVWALLGLLFVGGSVASCSDDPDSPPLPPVEPTGELAVSKVEANTAELVLKSQHLTEYAYVTQSDGSAAMTDPAVIFANGTGAACEDGDNTIAVKKLEPNTKYKVYLAAKTVEGGYFDKILTAEFTTIDYTETLTVTDLTGKSIAIHVKMPQETEQRGNVLRYALTDLVMYNMNKMGWMANMDAYMLEANGQHYLDESTTLYYDEDHMYETDENGEPILDESGMPISRYDPIVPGQPIVFMAGEFTWGESTYGWGEGWYKALFDFDGYVAAGGGGGGELLAPSSTRAVNEDDFWTGYFERLRISATEPTELNAKFTITEDLSPISAVLTITPDEAIKQYCLLLTDHATYLQIKEQILENNEKYLQWFPTSYYAFVQLGAMTLKEPAQIKVEDYYYIEPDVTYHVLLTGMGDENGTSQCFMDYTFTLPQPTKPAPVVEVKGIDNPNGEESPYEVWFNVKAPNKDVLTAKYVANYDRDMGEMLNMGYTYSMLVDSYGVDFGVEEIDKINSSEGLDMSFSSREDAETVLVVIGSNDEGTGNNPDEENSPAVGRKRTIAQPDAERVESELFTSLAGDWTASATLSRYDSDTREWVPDTEATKFKVSIGAIPSYPETLPEEVYDLYPTMEKEEVDALYAEFKELSDTYKNKVRGQNRLICSGFDIYGNTTTASFAFQSPYDLFINPSYNAWNTEALFYDFGPKWFLQIAADGTVSVPMNMNKLDPMANWDYNTYYLVGMGSDSAFSGPATDDTGKETEAWPAFPVTVSADKATLTVKPIVRKNLAGEDDNFYPTPAYLSANSYYPGDAKVVSDIVLTKGWTETAPAAKVYSAGRAAGADVAVPSVNGVKLMPKVRPHARTRVAKGAPVQYKQVEMKPVTQDMFKNAMIEAVKQRAENSRRR